MLLTSHIQSAYSNTPTTKLSLRVSLRKSKRKNPTCHCSSRRKPMRTCRAMSTQAMHKQSPSIRQSTNPPTHQSTVAAASSRRPLAYQVTCPLKAQLIRTVMCCPLRTNQLPNLILSLRKRRHSGSTWIRARTSQAKLGKTIRGSAVSHPCHRSSTTVQVRLCRQTSNAWAVQPSMGSTTPSRDR